MMGLLFISNLMLLGTLLGASAAGGLLGALLGGSAFLSTGLLLGASRTAFLASGGLLTSGRLLAGATATLSTSLSSSVLNHISDVSSRHLFYYTLRTQKKSEILKKNKKIRNSQENQREYK